MITKNENLGKFAVNNGKAYEARIGFDKDDNTVVKWYQIRGYRGAQIESLVRREGRATIYGVDVVPYA